jgi:dTDP-4-dehydrorhamnose reductase
MRVRLQCKGVYMRGIHVFGGEGWLGSQIVARFNAMPVGGVSDISDVHSVARWLDYFKPHTVINAAGRSGPPSFLRGVPGIPQNIDYCNMNDKTRAETRRSNVEGPRVLGRECTKRGIQVVQLSSGCLWNGPSPHADGAWRETDIPAPVSFYSETKVEGEQALIEECLEREPLIARLRLPIGGMPDGRNLVTKVSAYPEIIDVVNSVTVVDSLIFALNSLIRDGRTGIYHVTNPGPMSYRDFMDWYCEIVDSGHRDEFDIVPEEEIFKLGRAKEGRSSCILNTDKLRRDANIVLEHSKTAVRRCLQQYKEALAA